MMLFLSKFTNCFFLPASQSLSGLRQTRTMKLAKALIFLLITLLWPNLSVSQGQRSHVSPYVIYGPHGYKTYPHSRCQEVPTVEVDIQELEGDWNLVEYLTSFDGKPFPPHSPYLCPEARMTFTPNGASMNISQLSLEWPYAFKDVVQWEQHPDKSGVFFHEENIFALWTMKVMEVDPKNHLLFFFCIDYTIWPGWNHRGVFLLSRHKKLRTRVKKKLSPLAHRRMRINFHRDVNTTSCDLDNLPEIPESNIRWHPHRAINRDLITAPVHPWVSRGHRRNLEALD